METEEEKIESEFFKQQQEDTALLEEQDKEIIVEPDLGERSKKNGTTIKPGVQELFDSNPELANEVYEDLGFQGNINLESNLKNTGKTEQELIEYLKQQYPEIKLDISNNPIWEQGDNVFNQEAFDNQVQYRTKAVEILSSDKAKQVFEKGAKNGWDLNKILTELAIPKEQKQLILDKGFKVLTNNDARLANEPNLREQIITDLLANYSYTIEINLSTEGGNIGKNQGKAISEARAAGLKYGTKEFEDFVKNYLESKGEVYVEKPSQHYSNMTVPGGTNYTENEISTPAIVPSIKGHAQFATENGIGWFRSDEKITNIKYGKGIDNSRIDRRLEELTMQGLEGDEIDNILFKEFPNIESFDKTKTRRILEVQSDLFQKRRESGQLVERKPFNTNLTSVPVNTFIKYSERAKANFVYEKINNQWYVTTPDGKFQVPEEAALEDYNKSIQDTQGNTTDNQFLQLLNKDNNWVTFFIKSIIQDSAKKGYEKVLFPTGDTASKVEGHTTLEEFKKQKEDRIKELQKQLEKPEYVVDWVDTSGYPGNNIVFKTEQEALNYVKTENAKLPEDVEGGYQLLFNGERLNREIKLLKKELERVETEGFGALKPIYNFYENTVTNILKKQGYTPEVITDEYGNTWNEITVNQARDLSNVLLQRNEANQIIGQANIKAMSVLVDAVNKKADTIPHEYAHHYIAWFRGSKIVQEGIKRFGSEEALVQAIGEQVVKQKGEAYNWWKKFTNWVLSLLSDKQLLQILTDSFLNRQDLNSFTYNQITPQQKQQALQLYSQYLDTIFPDSKVKDIVYHDVGNTKSKDEPYRKDYIGKNDGGVIGDGFYFYTDSSKKYDENRTVREEVILNINNLSSVKELIDKTSFKDDWGLGIYEKALSELSGIKHDNKVQGKHGKYIGNYSAQLSKIGIDGLKGKRGNNTEIVVFEPEQIHILGSKQDIEGFKKFVEEESTSNEELTDDIKEFLSTFEDNFPLFSNLTLPERIEFFKSIDKDEIDVNCKL